MTIEERYERIEHLTAGLAEERRKDREEYKALWRDTQRQLDEIARAALENNRAIAELGILIRDLAEESRDADRRLGQRIDSLASAIGGFLRQGRAE
jgi:hypothetical protein